MVTNGHEACAVSVIAAFLAQLAEGNIKAPEEDMPF
jgi:hypothetical protein